MNVSCCAFQESNKFDSHHVLIVNEFICKEKMHQQSKSTIKKGVEHYY